MRSFNKEELTKICRFILYNTDVVVEEKYSKFLIENIFNRHPNWVHKRGVGIKHIEVRNNKYNQKSFYIVRIDGSETDISFVKSITYPNKISRIMRSCRTSVLPEILKIRNNIKLPFVCPITGETINDKHLIHIDHYDLTFEDLFYKWLDGKNIDELYEKTLKSKEDNNIEPYFDDDEINKDFLEFHNKHTHLRVVSKTANLSILRKKMNTKNVSDFLNTEVKEYVMDVVENREIPSVIDGQNGQNGQNGQLKEKYEKLQLDYFALKNEKEVKKDESNEKTKEQKSQWWDEI